ncbi:CHAT domain-containing protein [Saccharothrix deserti]|uniref:CHAT domain-containing protein n=1 Tax=Saccharothrix deserti TaxID=2593674 RepID=UPI00131E1B44|nr:CHAT domain-containing protein [Saccharothrix deserti]
MSYVYVMTEDEGSYRATATAADRYRVRRTGWRRWVAPGEARLLRRGTRRHARYLNGGDARHLDRAIRDLGEAVWSRTANARRRSLRRRPDPARCAHGLAAALFDKYRRTERLSDLDDAVDWWQEALDAQRNDTPLRASTLAALITAVYERAGTTSRREDLPDPIELARELGETTSAPVLTRLAAAGSWGYAAAVADGPAAGLPGLETAVRLLPRAAWWGHSRDTREEVLAEHTGLAADAAACAVVAGQPARALELLEGGRAVLWAQLLRTRTDRAALRRIAPRLAKRMDRVAEALERDHGTAGKRASLVARWSTMDERAHAELLREWERLARRAQEAVPGGTFTMPQFGLDLRPAGAEGPVVVVNASRLGCCALIVRDGEPEPRVVDLPSLSHSDALTRAARYVTALADGESEREQVVRETLTWLWQAVAEPVLDALGYRELPDATPWPRVWWCPTGPLMTLPLHAAGRHADSAAALDRVVSSYTPALKVLVHARRTRDAGNDADRRLLLTTPGEDPEQESLPGAARTRAHLEDLLPAERRTTLEGVAVTRAAVEAQLRRHVWAHFDCHGVQHLDKPFDGGLVLRDGTLTVADLAGIRHDHAEFAFLAACRTAVGGDRIPDEAITLTAALQHAGYQNVIGALWSVPDRPAARITRSVYDAIVRDGLLLPAESARALHDAIREERSRRPEHPSAWVPFLHAGL